MPLTIIISGPGGVGKGTVVSRLTAGDPILWLSRSWTTRERRPGEDNDAYKFVSLEEFKQTIDEGGFLEWAEYQGNLYGTPLPNSPLGKDVVLEIELEGAEQVLRRNPDALLIFIDAPSREVQIERLRKRGDSEEHVRKRVEAAQAEVERSKRLGVHTIVNDTVESSVAEIRSLIQQYRKEIRSRKQM